MTTQADQGVSQPAVLPIPNQLKPSYPSPHSPGGALAPPRRISPNDGPLSAPPISPSLLPERPSVPTRASTLGSENELGRHRQLEDSQDHARSEDLSHTLAPNPHDAVFAAPSPAYLSPSRPTTPGSSNEHIPSSSGHSDRSEKRLSASSIYSGSSNSQAPNRPPPTATSVSSVTSTTCSACGQTMQGAFVRALGTVYHLQCFKCMDCGTVVASKFFPIDGPDGKQQPLCERDYFRRLNLICAKCGMALRGSYITACNKKFHVEHFTCSICPTLFGPQDSYYEHGGDVYCHYHYSTRFATKCAGCNTAILKQFVEINRNMRDECWHPECYMINKFWNVKVVSRRSMNITPGTEPQEQQTHEDEETKETAVSLKEKQVRMEQQVYRIWTVLSAFEESSAACISDMLRQVSNGQYLEAIRMAEKFILHVEVLFATIDDLEHYFARLNLKGMSHVREARMLCRKTVDLFTLLSHTQETGARRMGMTQELLALVTGLAHYLKILIRIALTGALKLEREHAMREAMSSFLDKLHLLAVQGGNPSARRMMKGSKGETIMPPQRSGNAGTTGVTYGFRSLAPENAGESPFLGAPRDPALSNIPVVNPPSDLCVRCNSTVEEDCVRLGTYQRWHSHCVQCKQCGKAAAVNPPQEPPKTAEEREKEKEGGSGSKVTTVRRPPANVDGFVYELETIKETSSFGTVPTVVYCTEHAHAGCRSGFQAVSRLEQYAFLLNVALRRLYLLLKKRKVIPLTLPPSQAPEPVQDPYRNSGDIMRMKSVHLDRKLSATARLPKRSTIVESPTGKVAHSTDVLTSQQQQQQHHHHQHHQDRPHHHQEGAVVAVAAPVPQGPRTGGRAPPPFNPHAQSQQQQQQQQSSVGRSQGQQQRPQQGVPYPGGPPLRPLQPPGNLDLGPSQAQGQQVIRPSFARNNTEVMIVDDSGPASPTGGPPYDGMLPPPSDDASITLADIPQLVEVAQAFEQHRALPRQNSIPFIAELTPLELMIVKHAAVLILNRSPLRDQIDLDEILEMVEAKKQGFWGKFWNRNDKKNLKKKTGVFGVPLDLLVEKEGADSLHGASRATLRVPSFIDDVISAMRQMDMSVEGIFRKNGNIRRLKDLTEAIDRDPSSVDLTTDNPVQLAALLKKFLRDLPDPLMTFKLYKIFIASQNTSSIPNESERKRLLHMLSLVLPKAHRDTMEVLFVFLKWVASFSHLDEQTGSKMDLPNLATVICPSILYSPGSNAARYDDQFGSIRVVTNLLENQDVFFSVPEEFLPILRDQEYFAHSMELPSKEFLKKCDTYMRLKAAGRLPGPGPQQATSPGGGSPYLANNNSNPNSNPVHMTRPAETMESRLGPSLSRSPERPNVGPSMHSENPIRNGGYQPQSQSPAPLAPGLPHSPASYSGPSISGGGAAGVGAGGGGMPSSLSQGGASMMQYASSRSQEGGVPPSSSEEWENVQLQRPQQPFSNGVNGHGTSGSNSNSRPGSRPNSGSFSRSGGDSYPNPYQNGNGNGHMR